MKKLHKGFYFSNFLWRLLWTNANVRVSRVLTFTVQNNGSKEFKSK